MLTQFAHYRPWILLAFAAAIGAEIVWSRRVAGRPIYQSRETLANLGILLGHQLTKVLTAGYALSLMSYCYQWRVVTLPTNAGVFILTFLLTDFAYYWFHRFSHTWPWLWAFHQVHHSSPYLNLTTAYRLHWLGTLVNPLFMLPLALLGLPPTFVLGSLGLNLLYQFFCHTQAIGRLGWLEKVLDTPSNHRVHHGSNPVYLDKNYGGVLIIWDRLFGTFEAEKEPVRYGITTGFVSHNPVVLVFDGLWKWARGLVKE